jgi:hypothetical protein
MVDTDGQEEGEGEPGNKPVKAENQRILDDIKKIGRTEKPLEVVHADPGASPYSLPGGETLKRHKDTINGYVIKNKNIHKGNEQKDIQVTGIQNLSPERDPVNQGLNPGFIV